MERIYRHLNYFTFFEIFVIVLIQILSVKSQDLICNGNFTGYVMGGGKYDGELCQYVASDNACWFDKNGGQI